MNFVKIVTILVFSQFHSEIHSLYKIYDYFVFRIDVVIFVLVKIKHNCLVLQSWILSNNFSHTVSVEKLYSKSIQCPSVYNGQCPFIGQI